STTCLYSCIAGPPSLHSFPTRRSSDLVGRVRPLRRAVPEDDVRSSAEDKARAGSPAAALALMTAAAEDVEGDDPHAAAVLKRTSDRKSTRLNSRQVATSYAVFCLNKEK